jgi:hypothetical protein
MLYGFCALLLYSVPFSFRGVRVYTMPFFCYFLLLVAGANILLSSLYWRFHGEATCLACHACIFLLPACQWFPTLFTLLPATYLLVVPVRGSCLEAAVSACHCLWEAPAWFFLLCFLPLLPAVQHSAPFRSLLVSCQVPRVSCSCPCCIRLYLLLCLLLYFLCAACLCAPVAVAMFAAWYLLCCYHLCAWQPFYMVCLLLSYACACLLWEVGALPSSSVPFPSVSYIWKRSDAGDTVCSLMAERCLKCVPLRTVLRLSPACRRCAAT